MIKNRKIKILKEEIEKKREQLNKIVIEEISKDKILKFSQELDVLISEYTCKVAEDN